MHLKKLLTPSLLLLLLISTSSCSLFNVNGFEPVELYPAEIEEIIAPPEVEANTPFEVRIKGHTGCAELERVDEEKEGNQIRFSVWKSEKDNICGVVPAIFDITRKVTLETPGEYLIVSGELQTEVTVTE